MNSFRRRGSSLPTPADLDGARPEQPAPARAAGVDRAAGGPQGPVLPGRHGRDGGAVAPGLQDLAIAATLALPATGGSGMEAALINLLEPGDTVVIGDGGLLRPPHGRYCRSGCTTSRSSSSKARGARRSTTSGSSRPFATHRPRVLAVVHGETSTGVEQPFDGLAEVCREVGALLVVDAVATLGGVRLPVDELGIDMCYSGSQKCLSAPPGPGADHALRSRHAGHRAASHAGPELVSRPRAARALLGYQSTSTTTPRRC